MQGVRARVGRWCVVRGVLMLMAVLLAAALPAHAAAPDNAPARPRVGLVLAGGGAKGAAHIGVLKVLEALRIPVDVVAGTSMGSIVGGLYASGMRPDDIEREVQQIDWVDMFVDAPNREDRSFRRKTDDVLYMFKAKPGFSDGKIKLPLAYIQGQKLDLQLNRLTRPVAGIKDFDHLPIPFRAIAADIETGAEVVLGQGSLPRALRASMAVPGAFDPVELDGKLLVDGGIANNVPINVARAMGADIVIVSELGTDMLKRDQIASGLDVAAQMVNFLFVINSRQQLDTLGPRDVRIAVALGDIGAGSFDRIRDAIPLGEQAAQQAVEALRQYALDEREYARHLAARTVSSTDLQHIDFVRIENESSVSDAVVASYLSARPGGKLDTAQLEADIQQIYGLEIFESVRYELVEEQGGTGLVLRTREKNWGPGYLQTGMITSSNFKGDSAFRLGVTYTRMPTNALNGEWRVGGQIGDEPALFTEIFQPLDPAARYFFAGKASYQTWLANTFDDEGNKLSERRVRGPGLDLAVGRQFGTWGEARVGVLRRTGRIEVGVGAPEPDTRFDIGEAYLRLTSDKFDSLYFPTKGHFARAEWRTSRTSLGADNDFDQASVIYQGAWSSGRNTLIGGVTVHATVDGVAPVQSLNRLGGFMNLSGYDDGRLSGQHAGLARLVLMRRINDIQQFQTRIGISLESGNVWQKRGDIGFDDNIQAASVFIGADTPIGPLYLGYGRNDAGEGSAYLYLGPLFSF